VLYKLNQNCSVYPQAGFEAQDVVYQCLVPFPYVWASLDKVLFDGTCPMTLPVVEFLVGKYQLPHALQIN
jgi:hypothetical protein